MRTLVAEVKSRLGEEVTVCGWVHRIRDLGKVSFVLLRDRSGMVQLVLPEKPQVAVESVVSVTATVAANTKAPGGVELQVRSMDPIAAAAADIPIPVNQDPEKLSLEAILEHRFISLRNPKILAIFRLQASILKFFAQHLREQSFTEIKSSKLIGTATEGGTGLFAVDYFGEQVFLAQSPQFYKQAMVASGLEKVFEVGPVYRAEKHDTPRHLNEYISMDVEMAFIEGEQELMDLEAGILKAVFAGLAEENQKELAVWGAKVPEPQQVDQIPRISHDQAREIISSRRGKRVYEISPEGERVLCDWALQEHGIEAIFVYGFPRKKRPFYTFPLDQRITMSFDCLFRGLEITTGGRRIHEYPMLLDNIRRFGLDPESLFDYLQIFKYGCPPHGGFAIGLERLTQKILGLDNVKQAALFPRDRRRTRP